jgi:Glycosyl transferases group 1
MSQKHALVASNGIPEGDRDSGGRRRLDLMDFLRDAGYTITFVAVSPITNHGAADILQRRGITVRDGMLRRNTAAAPEPVLHEILAEHPVDLALLAEWPVAELYLPILRRVCPNARVLVDSVDLHCLRHARCLFAGRGSGPGMLDAEFAVQLTGELNSYAAADGVLTVSQKEAAWIDDFCGGIPRTFYVPDCEDDSPGSPPFSERRGMLVLANYQYPPNVDGVEFLCAEILPHVDERLRREHPLFVVGNGLDELILDKTKNTPNTQLVGWVPSVTPYFQRARISLVPLRYGAGTKRKMVQALTCGTPTVTTTVGAEGLDLLHGQHALIADEPKEFAASIEQLLTDELLWRRIAENGRALMLATHSREAARQKFFSALKAIQATPPRPGLLPEISTTDYFNHIHYDYLAQLSSRLRLLLTNSIPADATVIVLSGGHQQLLNLDGRTAWHFPQTDDGRPTPDPPGTFSEALTALEKLRQQGGRYLLVPFPQYWWLDHFPEFGRYVNQSCRLIASKEDVGMLVSLNAPAWTPAIVNTNLP